MVQGKEVKEFSKKIIIAAAVINVAVIVFSMVMIIVTKDLSPLCYLIPSVSAEVATGTAFYYSKAKVENRIKLMKSYGIEPDGDDFKEY